MLNIYPVVLELIGSLRPLLSQIERRDRDLGRQLRRASSRYAGSVGGGEAVVGIRSRFALHSTDGRVPWGPSHKSAAFQPKRGGPVRSFLETVNAYKRRMGWKFPWVSSQGSDFNRDFSAFNEQDRKNGTGLQLRNA